MYPSCRNQRLIFLVLCLQIKFCDCKPGLIGTEKYLEVFETINSTRFQSPKPTQPTISALAANAGRPTINPRDSSHDLGAGGLGCRDTFLANIIHVLSFFTIQVSQGPCMMSRFSSASSIHFSTTAAFILGPALEPAFWELET